MKELLYSEFAAIICEDYGIELYEKVKFPIESFPIINGKRSIKMTGVGSKTVIVDRGGKEHPYMLQFGRNNEKLQDFDYLYFTRIKFLADIEKEIGHIVTTSKKVKICEGGGWQSDGYRTFYKDYYCE